MSKLHTRAEAGLRAPTSRVSLSSARHLTAHYGGPSPWGRAGIGDHSRCAGIWRGWQAFHMGASRGWSDIAYNSAVCPHGHRFEGRGVGVRSAANGTSAGNTGSYATVYLAGDDDPLTDPAKVAFLLEAQRFGVPLNRSHSDWKATSCPGDPVRAWVRAGCPPPKAAFPVAPAPPIVLPPPLDYTKEPDMLGYYISHPKYGVRQLESDGVVCIDRPVRNIKDIVPGRPVIENADPDFVAALRASYPVIVVLDAKDQRVTNY